MGERGPESKYDIDDIVKLHKLGWSKAEIGRSLDPPTSGQLVGKLLKSALKKPAATPVKEPYEPAYRLPPVYGPSKTELIKKMEELERLIRFGSGQEKLPIKSCPDCGKKTHVIRAGRVGKAPKTGLDLRPQLFWCESREGAKGGCGRKWSEPVI